MADEFADNTKQNIFEQETSAAQPKPATVEDENQRVREQRAKESAERAAITNQVERDKTQRNNDLTSPIDTSRRLSKDTGASVPEVRQNIDRQIADRTNAILQLRAVDPNRPTGENFLGPIESVVTDLPGKSIAPSATIPNIPPSAGGLLTNMVVVINGLALATDIVTSGRLQPLP